MAFKAISSKTYQTFTKRNPFLLRNSVCKTTELPLSSFHLWRALPGLFILTFGGDGRKNLLEIQLDLPKSKQGPKETNKQMPIGLSQESIFSVLTLRDCKSMKAKPSITTLKFYFKETLKRNGSTSLPGWQEEAPVHQALPVEIRLLAPCLVTGRSLPEVCP